MMEAIKSIDMKTINDSKLINRIDFYEWVDFSGMGVFPAFLPSTYQVTYQLKHDHIKNIYSKPSESEMIDSLFKVILDDFAEQGSNALLDSTDEPYNFVSLADREYKILSWQDKGDLIKDAITHHSFSEDNVRLDFAVWQELNDAIRYNKFKVIRRFYTVQYQEKDPLIEIDLN